ncbi:hypothetical protein [endosymbiont of Lamellibrachia barhami]|uniref:hypothetical protein n=1 Tax=endosymbiont of Lamellibrachia barhami TaxID=205975 RepID=UPI0034E1AB87
MSWLADALSELGQKEPSHPGGILLPLDDSHPHRHEPGSPPSDLPVPVDDRHIVLIDDVLHTGRTMRAALNEIFQWRLCNT